MVKKVLLVDDDVDILKLFKIYLERNGNEVYTAKNEKDAMFLYRSISPEIVFMDINLSSQDGIEIAKKMLDEKKITLIFWTCSVDDVVLARARKISNHVIDKFNIFQKMDSLLN